MLFLNILLLNLDDELSVKFVCVVVFVIICWVFLKLVVVFLMEFIFLYVLFDLEEGLCLFMVDIELLNLGMIVIIFVDFFSCVV